MANTTKREKEKKRYLKKKNTKKRGRRRAGWIGKQCCTRSTTSADPHETSQWLKVNKKVTPAVLSAAGLQMGWMTQEDLTMTLDDFQMVSGTLRAVNEKKWRFGRMLPTYYSQTTKYSATQLAQSLKFKPSHDPIRGKQGGDTTVLQLRRLVSKWLKSSGPPTQIEIVRRCFT